MARWQDLPREVRLEIYDRCALSSAAKPGVYCFSEADLGDRCGQFDTCSFTPADGTKNQAIINGVRTSFEDSSQSLPPGRLTGEVILGVPKVMHLCHEARTYLRSKLRFNFYLTLSNLHEGRYHTVGVAKREYIPEIGDIIFLPTDSCGDFLLAAMDQFQLQFSGGNNTWLGRIEHLALHTEAPRAGLGNVLGTLPFMVGVKKITFVVGSYKPTSSSAKVYQLDFWHPGSWNTEIDLGQFEEMAKEFPKLWFPEIHGTATGKTSRPEGCPKGRILVRFATLREGLRYT